MLSSTRLKSTADLLADAEYYRHRGNRGARIMLGEVEQVLRERDAQTYSIRTSARFVRGKDLVVVRGLTYADGSMAITISRDGVQFARSIPETEADAVKQFGDWCDTFTSRGFEPYIPPPIS